MLNSSATDIEKYLRESHNANLARQQAELGMARDKEIESLRQSYDKAVQDGELSVKDAENMFIKQKEEIDKQAYLDVQASAVNAQNLGIQHSMQYGAMQADDAMRRANLTNDASSDRNSRVSAIRDRLKQLSTDTDRAIINVNSDHDYQLAMGKSGLDAEFNQMLAQLRQEQAQQLAERKFQLDMGAIQQGYQQSNMEKQYGYDVKLASQQQKYALEQMAKSYGYDIKKMSYDQKLQFARMAKEQGYQLQILDKQHKYTLDQMAKAYGFDLKKMSYAQKLDLAKMAKEFGYNLKLSDKQLMNDLAKMEKQHGYTLEQYAVQQGYDLEKMSTQQKYALAQMAKQNGYDVEMEGIQYGYRVALSDVELANAVKLKQKEYQLQADKEMRDYELAKSRELAKYKRGTSEYKIREAQLEDEKRALQKEWSSKMEFDIVSNEILNGQTTKPTKPKKKFFESQKKYEGRLREYEAKLKAYERYLQFKKNPESFVGSKSEASGSGLGTLSKKYESNGNPGAIGRNAGDIGGASYGSYQLTTNSGNAQKFASQYGGALAGKKAGTYAFDQAWKAEAKKNPVKFAQAQHNYIAKTHYQPAVSALNKALGFNLSSYPKAIQDVIWSVSVQHGVGGAVNVFKTAGVRKGDSAKTIVNKVYAVRGQFFSRSSASIRASVQRRFAQEKQDALRMLG